MDILKTCLLSHFWPFCLHLNYPITLLPIKHHSPVKTSSRKSPSLCPHPQCLATAHELKTCLPTFPKQITFIIKLYCTLTVILCLYICLLSQMVRFMMPNTKHASFVFVNPSCLPLSSYSVTICNLNQICSPLEQRSPTFLAPGTGFVEDNFSMDEGWGDGSGSNAGDGSGRWSFTRSPATHLLLCGPVPNRLQTGTSTCLEGWGPLL